MTHLNGDQFSILKMVGQMLAIIIVINVQFKIFPLTFRWCELMINTLCGMTRQKIKYLIGFQFDVYLNACFFVVGSSPLFWMVDLKPIQFSSIRHIIFINDGVTRFDLVSSKGVTNGIIEWVDSYYGNFYGTAFSSMFEQWKRKKEKSWHDW